MHDLKWSESEKKVARRVFEAALTAELAEVMAEFKARAAAAAKPDDLWSIQEHLDRTRREIDRKYDYRYSQLIVVFGRLLREGRIQDEQQGDCMSDPAIFVIQARPDIERPAE